MAWASPDPPAPGQWSLNRFSAGPSSCSARSPCSPRAPGTSTPFASSGKATAVVGSVPGLGLRGARSLLWRGRRRAAGGRRRAGGGLLALRRRLRGRGGRGRLGGVLGVGRGVLPVLRGRRARGPVRCRGRVVAALLARGGGRRAVEECRAARAGDGGAADELGQGEGRRRDH